MEGRIAPGQEQFSQFLIGCIIGSPVLHDMSPQYKFALSLYLSLLYGDPKTERTIPIAFAKKHGIFSETIAAIEQQIADLAKQEQEEFLRRKREGRNQLRL